MDTFGDDHYVGIKEITMDMKVKLEDILADCHSCYHCGLIY